jgi:3-hydroxybutyrate dehydrogenase
MKGRDTPAVEGFVSSDSADRRRLRNKAALITGSTSGIGLGIARALAREGARVMLNGFGDPAALEQLRDTLARETGVRVGYHAADLTRPAEVAELVATTESEFGSLDILVNNAGVQFVSPIEQFPPERWDAIHEIMVTGSFHAIRAALPGMKRRNSGRIITIASAHGLVASPFKSAYVAAKHAQVGLTKAVALEVAAHNITCNAICPGYVRTPLVEGQIDDQAKAHGMSREDVIRDVILAAQPTRRFIEIEEVAQLVVYLCGDDARSVTGAAIPIDGGWTAR